MPEQILAEMAAASDVAMRALTMLLALGRSDLVEEIRSQAVAEAGNNIGNAEIIDMATVREFGRRHVETMIDATLLASRSGAMPN